jgi:hypothetical protein
LFPIESGHGMSAVSLTMALCETCSGVTLKGLQSASEIPYYPHLGLDDLRVSAKTCRFCDLLLTTLCKEHIAELRLPDDYQTFKDQGKSLTPLYPAPTQVRLSLKKIPKFYISEKSAISPDPDVALYVALAGMQLPIPFLVSYLDIMSAATSGELQIFSSAG